MVPVADENRKSFGCQACGTTFVRADVLQRHLKKCAGNLNRDAVEKGIPAVSDGITASLRQETMAGDQATQPVPTVEHDTPPDSFILCYSERQLDHGTEVRQQAQHQQPTPGVQRHPLGQGQPDSDQVMLCNTIATQLEATISQPVTAFPNPLYFGSGNFINQPLDAIVSQENGLASLPNFNPSDFTFLEDALLPEFSFDALGLSPAIELLSEVPETGRGFSIATEILSSRTRHVTPTPSPNDAPEARPEYQAANYAFRAIRCSEEDAATVQRAFVKANALATDLQASIPTRSRISRWLNAYFEYFDPHTPIVHRPTFVISTTPGECAIPIA
ncbi:uncharacterized protein A1O5_10379 [Cladophialophora psammophila CBS 110553]|uniref:C2H2-type domain-containing protein n=1 Tax=Cladophialophora psammophila CBS 110553 TaxID=1182543 RepID=W9WFI2_9EURO|nr:uncharacterized protein A1O5_10379 [Cladophialophora psammophila CBS 110553]EXJ66708.1 hypothetical protein A1O5_10379 [Cladophialophora psammophila CBS 110553]